MILRRSRDLSALPLPTVRSGVRVPRRSHPGAQFCRACPEESLDRPLRRLPRRPRTAARGRTHNDADHGSERVRGAARPTGHRRPSRTRHAPSKDRLAARLIRYRVPHDDSAHRAQSAVSSPKGPAKATGGVLHLWWEPKGRTSTPQASQFSRATVHLRPNSRSVRCNSQLLVRADDYLRSSLGPTPSTLMGGEKAPEIGNTKGTRTRTPHTRSGFVAPAVVAPAGTLPDIRPNRTESAAYRLGTRGPAGPGEAPESPERGCSTHVPLM